jgi:hypothetical protein
MVFEAVAEAFLQHHSDSSDSQGVGRMNPEPALGHMETFMAPEVSDAIISLESLAIFFYQSRFPLASISHSS